MKILIILIKIMKSLKILINAESKKSFKNNSIKGILKVELNETNKDIFLFKTKINDGIDVYLKEEKINTIKDKKKYNNYYKFRNEGLFFLK